jgi:DNA-binding protein H-NS
MAIPWKLAAQNAAKKQALQGAPKEPSPARGTPHLCGAFVFCIMRASNLRGNCVATYLELKEQAEKLLAEAERMREQEIAEAIADIKRKIGLYGLTAADLGFARSTGPVSSRPKAAKSPVKYRGPNGETWSGGRGRKPQWVTQALQQGRNLEEFAVKNGR